VQQTLQERWGQLQDASNDDMEHLARMYGTMKPDQAASIFNQMDSDFAAGFMRLMRSEQAGMILAGMETRKAYAVSLKLAALNEDVRNASSDN
jgi:flagellar motility protein MotE (MotC chaperone)